MQYPVQGSIQQQRVPVNGVELDVLVSGPSDGPLIVLAHGFPECAWSWRHQIAPLAAAGWRVIVPDQRGYGGSTKPTAVTDFGIDQLTGDLLGLVDHFGGPGASAVFVGHDWGALVVWDLGRLHPERCRAVIGVSVPFTQWPMMPTELFRKVYGDTFFYMQYFQTVGPAETELGADPRRTMRMFLWSASGDVPRNEDALNAPPRPAAGTGFLDVMTEPPGGQLPNWCTAQDLDVYTAAFSESGFFGPVSWYRNLDANYARVQDFPPSRLTMPTFFIGGSNDGVIRDRSRVSRMTELLPDFRESVILEGPGHWTQQEAPDAFNAVLLRYLTML